MFPMKKNKLASRPIRIPVGSHKSLDIAPFLNEIERVLPTIEGPEHRAVVEGVRSYFIAHCLASRLESSYRPPSLEILSDMIETLRCAGIAPPGWPVPPGPDALLQVRAAFVPGWDATQGKEGPP